MIPFSPPNGKINTDPLGKNRIDLLRCKECRKGLDTSLSSGKACPVCGGRQWTNRVGRLSLWETFRLWRETGVVFTMENSWLERITGKRAKEREVQR